MTFDTLPDLIDHCFNILSKAIKTAESNLIRATTKIDELTADSSFSPLTSRIPETFTRVGIAFSEEIDEHISRFREIEGGRIVEKTSKNQLHLRQLYDLHGLTGWRDAAPNQLHVLHTCDEGFVSGKYGRNSLTINLDRKYPIKKYRKRRGWWILSTEKDGPKDIQVKEPLIPKKLENTYSDPDPMRISHPFVVIIETEISADDQESSMNDVIEIRSLKSAGVLTHEVFSMTRNRGSLRLTGNERIFVGSGIIRIVTSAKCWSKKLPFTLLQRDLWKCALNQATPTMHTAVEPVNSPISSIVSSNFTSPVRTYSMSSPSPTIGGSIPRTDRSEAMGLTTPPVSSRDSIDEEIEAIAMKKSKTDDCQEKSACTFTTTNGSLDVEISFSTNVVSNEKKLPLTLDSLAIVGPVRLLDDQINSHQ